ncbi:MAG TPA: dTMP kinase, partial [Candidatus Saccharimonadales bacterium]
LGEAVRELLLEFRDDDWDTMIEVLLFNAARRPLIAKHIGRLTTAGMWVGSDRTFLSSIVYQGHARGELAMTSLITNATVQGYKPDLLMVVLADVKTALSRQIKPDRIGSEDFEFHKLVMNGFRQEALERRLPIIDGDVPLEQVYEQAWLIAKPHVEHYLEKKR